MSDDNEESAPNADEGVRGSQAEQIGVEPGIEMAVDGDWLFIDLVAAVNSASKTNLPIIVSLAGTIIAGDLVSGKRYFEEIGKRFTGLEDKFNETGEQLYGEAADKNRRPEYFHLENARIFAPGQPPIPANKGVWWRGRIRSVDVFSLGQLKNS